MIKFASCDECEKGNNRVVLWTTPPDFTIPPSTWFIYNVETKRWKYIGKVGSKRINYYDRAHEVAHRRNRDESKKHQEKSN